MIQPNRSLLIADAIESNHITFNDVRDIHKFTNSPPHKIIPYINLGRGAGHTEAIKLTMLLNANTTKYLVLGWSSSAFIKNFGRPNNAVYVDINNPESYNNMRGHIIDYIIIDNASLFDWDLFPQLMHAMVPSCCSTNTRIFMVG